MRAQGLLSGAGGFGAKVGMGIGGWLAGWVLSNGGYVAGAIQTEAALAAIQTEAALAAIRTNFIIIPLITSVIGGVFILFYKLDKQYDTIIKELHERRAAAEE